MSSSLWINLPGNPTGRGKINMTCPSPARTCPNLPEQRSDLHKRKRSSPAQNDRPTCPPKPVSIRRAGGGSGQQPVDNFRRGRILTGACLVVTNG